MAKVTDQAALTALCPLARELQECVETVRDSGENGEVESELRINELVSELVLLLCKTNDVEVVRMAVGTIEQARQDLLSPLPAQVSDDGNSFVIFETAERRIVLTSRGTYTLPCEVTVECRSRDAMGQANWQERAACRARDNAESGGCYVYQPHQPDSGEEWRFLLSVLIEALLRPGRIRTPGKAFRDA